VVGIVLKITDTTTSQFFDTWGLLLTFVLGFVIYTAATHFAKPSWFAMRRENDPALEVDDPDEARVRCHSCDKSYLAREMDRDPSAGQQAICAECGSTSGPFYHAARVEAKALADGGQAREPAGAVRE